MLCREDICQLTEVLSLSVQGLFVKTGFRLEKGEQIKVFFPLMGMKKELEIDGQVLYRVHPDPENNYLQGLGIEFIHMEEEDRAALETFLENRFLGEVSESPQGAGGVAPEQLRSRIPSLHLM
jgi:Tfp pilus assembly protein PilZ